MMPGTGTPLRVSRDGSGSLLFTGYPVTTVTSMPWCATRSSASSVNSCPVAPVSGQYERLK